MFIFDFDGVLVDSLSEVLVTAYNTVTGELHTSLDELPPNYERLFRRHRFRVQPAADFPVFAQWCIQNCAADSPDELTSAEFNKRVDSAAEPPSLRRDRFFATRRKFLDANRRAWLDLNQPYRPLWDVLARRGADRLVILTNKNRLAVLDLCHHFGLPVGSDNVYAADGGATKIENLEAILRRFGQRRFHFIDDSVLNLLELRDQGSIFAEVTFLMASWGYVGPEDEERARRVGISTFSQDEFIIHLQTFN